MKVFVHAADADMDADTRAAMVLAKILTQYKAKY